MQHAGKEAPLHLRWPTTESEYVIAALRVGTRRSAANSSKYVGRVAPSPPRNTKDISAFGTEQLPRFTGRCLFGMRIAR
jgi:hypothetical protein